MNEIPSRLADVRRRIAAAAVAAGRAAEDVQLLAVSKTKPVEDILAAWSGGQRRFGENYLQDALPKIHALSAYPIEWHYIGRLQGNKTAEVAGNFAWVHSLDQLRHALRLDRQRPPELPPLMVCIQVNLSGETSKGGVSADALPELVAAVSELPGLRLRGLMTMPDPTYPGDRTRATFRRLHQLLSELRQSGRPLDTLSMGMSADLELAIAEGATIVRIGTDVFGPRGTH